MTPEERAERAIGAWVETMFRDQGRVITVEGSVALERAIASAIRAAQAETQEQAARRVEMVAAAARSDNWDADGEGIPAALDYAAGAIRDDLDGADL